MERFVYQERNLKELMKYYLSGRVALANEIRLANITYYPEQQDLSEPNEERLSA